MKMLLTRGQKIQSILKNFKFYKKHEQGACFYLWDYDNKDKVSDEEIGNVYLEMLITQ